MVSTSDLEHLSRYLCMHIGGSRILGGTSKRAGRPVIAGRLRQAVVGEDASLVGLGAQQYCSRVGGCTDHGVYGCAEGECVWLCCVALHRPLNNQLMIVMLSAIPRTFGDTSV